MPEPEFPDRNLDTLRERTASMQPGRQSLTGDLVELALPVEPDHDKVIVELDESGHEGKIWYWHGDGYLDEITPEYLAAMDEDERSGYLSDVHSFAGLVRDAIGQGYRLGVRSR